MQISQTIQVSVTGTITNVNHLKDVSILVTCFNKAPFIESFREQLESIKTYAPEIIIVDDSSKDGSREKLTALTKDISHITLILNEENYGSARSRNKAMHYATRNWIFFWDIDDRVNFEVLNDMVEQAQLQGVDLCKGNYSISPSEGPTPETILKDTLSAFPISDFATSIVEEMGYWRFLYSRRFLEENKIIFAPPSMHSNSRSFILDDVFFLIFVAAANGHISFSHEQQPVYIYSPTFHSDTTWENFQRQAAIFSKASLNCIQYAKHVGSLNNDLVYELILRKAITHMQYLNFFHWANSIVDFIRLIFITENSMRLTSKLALVERTLMRSIKNSIASKLHKTSS